MKEQRVCVLIAKTKLVTFSSC